MVLKIAAVSWNDPVARFASEKLESNVQRVTVKGGVMLSTFWIVGHLSNSVSRRDVENLSRRREMH